MSPALAVALGRLFVLIVTGVSGEPPYAQAFTADARSIIASLHKAGLPSERITWLAETEQPGAAGRSTRERVESEVVRLAGAAGGDDQLVVVFIGHGSDQGEPMLNLPGPDLGASDLARMFAGYGTRQVAVVVAASSSGGFVEKLAGPNRLVITATRTGAERNATRFGHWFAEALATGEADTDKDGALSLLEAFTYAVREVARESGNANRLQTEHARISDSTLARRFVLGEPALAVAGDSATRALLEKKRSLEEQIAALRARKAQLDSTAYQRQLEDLLVQLATVNQQLKRP